MAFTIVKAESRVVPKQSGGFDLKYLYEILVDSSADLDNVPDDGIPGSRAYTADGTYEAIKDNDGTWVERGGSSDGQNDEEEPNE